MKAAKTLMGIVKIVIGLGVMTVIIIWMSGGFREKVAPDAGDALLADTVWTGPTAEVTLYSYPAFEKVAGTIQAAKRTAVSSKIMAQVEQITVNAGAEVKAGDLLIRLDSRDIEAQVQQVRQEVESAKASYEQTDADFKRAENLVKNGNISQSQFDQARTARDVAKARWEQANRAFEEAKVARSFAEISAPVSGRVVERLVEPGDMVSPGQPLLQIYDPQTLRLEVPVRESLATQIQQNALQVQIDAIDSTLTGNVDEVVPQADVGARTFLVKVVLPRHEHLYPGMFGRLLVPIGERSRLVVPQHAIETIGQLQFAGVVDADGNLHRRLVTMGRTLEEDRVEVLSGLKANEKVALPAAK